MNKFDTNTAVEFIREKMAPIPIDIRVDDAAIA